MTKRLAAAGFGLLLATALSADTIGYNPGVETTVSGVIRGVISVTSPDGTVGVHLELATDGGPVRVHLAPALFIGMNNFFFVKDDVVTIRGAMVSHAGETALWVRSIEKEGRTLVLRDEDGTPRWPRATADDPDGCGVPHAPVR